MQKGKLFILTLILILLNTFAYSALSTSLSITGEANFRSVKDIRIKDISYKESQNDAVLSYESTYKKDTITNGFVLPNLNSSITYTITIQNKGLVDAAIYDILTMSSNNNDMIILIDGEPISNKIPMIIGYMETKQIDITYKTNSPSNNIINIVNKLDFKTVHYVTYDTKGGTSVERQIKYENVDLTLEGSPTKEGYIFKGWTDEQNGTTVKFNTGDIYTLDQNIKFYAIYAPAEAIFLPGEEFNAKIKQLAGNNNATYETNDTNITSIVRASTLPNNFTPTNTNVVSTSSSGLPIYAWYDNGTIYYYTSATQLYMNSNANNMFRGLTNVSTININTIDTSRMTVANYLFANTTNLSSIDLSNFNTSGMNNMSRMFEQTYFTSLDLSGFDMSNVTNVENMFNNSTSLQQLKTPKVYPSNLSITLPKTLYMADNTAYTTLNSSSPTKTWLKTSYTVVFNKNNNDATGTMNNQLIGVDATTTLSPNTFTSAGYTFVGWNTEPDGSGTPYLDEASVSNLGTFNETITLYAQWIEKTYTITFDSNSGTFENNETTNTVVYRPSIDEVTRVSHTPNVTDAGVKEDILPAVREIIDKVKIPGASQLNVSITYKTYNSSQYAALYDGSVTTATSNINSSISGKLYGTTQTTRQYTITGDTAQFLFYNGYYNSPYSYNNYYGYHATITATGTVLNAKTGTYEEPVKDDYIFIGWNTEADGSGEMYKDEYSLANLTNSVTLYAQFKKPTATFLPGQEFNVLIKKLSGQSTATYSTKNTSITSIERYNEEVTDQFLEDKTVVSTSNSETKIYAWYDNGIIYYYTIADTIYFNSNIDYMFYYLAGITKLDLSEFDLSKVSSANSTMSSMNSIFEIITPNIYSIRTSVTLPKTMYNMSNTAYSSLYISSPRKVSLKIGYTITINTSYYDANNGTQGTNTTKTIRAGNPIGTLPTINVTRAGYDMGGIYTDDTYTTEVTSETIPTSNVTYYIKWNKKDVWANEIFYDNSNTNLNCTTAQCVVDYLSKYK